MDKQYRVRLAFDLHVSLLTKGKQSEKDKSTVVNNITMAQALLEPFIGGDANKEHNATEKDETEKHAVTTEENMEELVHTDDDEAKKEETDGLKHNEAMETHNSRRAGDKTDSEDIIVVRMDKDTIHCEHCSDDHPNTAAACKTICPRVREAWDQGKVCSTCGNQRGSEGLQGIFCDDMSCEIDEKHDGHAHACLERVRMRCEALKGCCGDGSSSLGHCKHRCPKITALFSWRELAFLLLGLVLYLWDVVSDMVLATEYFNEGEIIWGSLTILFFLTAGVIASFLNVYQWRNVRQESSIDLTFVGSSRVVQWISTGFCLTAVVLATPVMWVAVAILMWRQGRKYMNGCSDFASTKILKLYEMLQHKRINSQMVESFIESALQFLLQLYIIFRSPWEGVTWRFCLQVVSISSAVVSLSWTLTGVYFLFHVCHVYHANDLKEKLLVLLWHFFLTIPRFLAMALFASVYPWFIFAVFFLHTLIVFIGHTGCSVEAKKGEHGKQLNSLLVALISNFGFNRKIAFHEKSKKEETSRFQERGCYCRFYTLVYVENIIMASLWFYKFSASFTHKALSNYGNSTAVLWANVTELANTTGLSGDAEEFISPFPYWLGAAAYVFIYVSVAFAACCRYIQWRKYMKGHAEIDIFGLRRELFGWVQYLY